MKTLINALCGFSIGWFATDFLKLNMPLNFWMILIAFSVYVLNNLYASPRN